MLLLLHSKVMYAETKGRIFLRHTAHIVARHGPEALSSILAAMPSEAGKSLSNNVLLASGWYPSSWFAELWRVTRQQVRMTDEDVRRLVYYEVIDELRGPLNYLLSLVVRPSLAVRFSARVMSQFHRGGTIRAEVLSPVHRRTTFMGWNGFSRDLWLGVDGGTQGLLASLRLRDVAVNLTIDPDGEGAQMITHVKSPRGTAIDPKYNVG